MVITLFSLLWVMQDFVHQPYPLPYSPPPLVNHTMAMPQSPIPSTSVPTLKQVDTLELKLIPREPNVPELRNIP